MPKRPTEQHVGGCRGLTWAGRVHLVLVVLSRSTGRERSEGNCCLFAPFVVQTAGKGAEWSWCTYAWRQPRVHMPTCVSYIMDPFCVQGPLAQC
ncbi:hypothetical protein BD309DRAFT_605551 [Dichomitus squalens]|nr:hypothetical protein BD309DRAFT_605551 [Dichomitus squalens]